MIHVFDDGTSVDILGKVVPYIKYRGYISQEIDVNSVKHKGVDIKKDSPRYLAADTKFPVIVVKKEGYFKLVDGRNRLLKTLVNGGEVIKAFILSDEELNLFRQ